MPRRLIRISGHPNESVLIETRGETIPYVALSHCWAYGEVLKTTSKTHWETGIPDILLSDTLRSAMIFTRKLGYHHIWIDSLCIVQGDLDDWAREASHMGVIYREAVLVISVAVETKSWFDGTGDYLSQGVSNPRQPTFRLQNKHRKYMSEPGRFIIHRPISHMNLHKDPPKDQKWRLFTRGWTLQERLLATRIVHFAPLELTWECKSEAHCECGFLDNQMERSFKTTYDKMLQTRPSANSLMESWRHLVCLYMERKLTEESDRLPAISSLARQHSSPELGTYLAGSWQNHLLEMISWYVNHESSSGQRRPTCYIAPSWCWASLVGSIDWDWSDRLPLSDLPEFVAEIQEAECKLSRSDPFGPVGSGHLVISSPHLVCKIIIEDGDEPRLDHAALTSCLLDADPVHGQYEVEDGQEVTCLFLNRIVGDIIPAIIIKSCGGTSDSYVRVGRAHAFNHDMGWPHVMDQPLKVSLGVFKII